VTREIPPEPPRPDWLFGPEVKIKCPECKTFLTGIDWIMGKSPDDPALEVAAGMTVIPCGHRFPTPPWRYDVSGRGNITIFKEKNR
jgi:hypothetical protein